MDISHKEVNPRSWHLTPEGQNQSLPWAQVLAYLVTQRAGKQGTGLRHFVECWVYTWSSKCCLTPTVCQLLLLLPGWVILTLAADEKEGQKFIWPKLDFQISKDKVPSSAGHFPAWQGWTHQEREQEMEGGAGVGWDRQTHFWPTSGVRLHIIITHSWSCLSGTEAFKGYMLMLISD